MSLTFTETPLYYRDSQGQYHRVLSGADMTGYRTAAAQDAIDAAQDAEIETISHRNLLDNWYFVGGGSQLGHGVFPINQKGQTSYSNNGYNVDRWFAVNTSVTFKDDSINIKLGNGLTSRQRFRQNLGKRLASGCTYTFSALVKVISNTNNLLRIWLSQTGTSFLSYVPNVSPSDNLQLITWTFTLPAYSDDLYIEFITSETNASILAELDIKACKLELGSYQTLAHLEGTDWVLNEIPDYGEELVKCQRYYIKFDRYIASGFLTNSGKEYNIPIYLPITMAGSPTVTMSGYVARTPNGYSAHTGGSWTAPTTLRVYYPNNGFVLLADTINSAVDTNNIQINYYIKDLVLTV